MKQRKSCQREARSKGSPPPQPPSVAYLELRLDAVEDRLEGDAEGVAEFADADVGGDGEHRLDDLRLSEMLVKAISKLR